MVCFSEVVLCYSPRCLKCRQNLNSHINGENIIWGGELFLSPQMNVLFPSNSLQFLLGIDRLLFGCWERWGYKTGTVPQISKILFHNLRSWAHLLKCTCQRLFPSFFLDVTQNISPGEDCANACFACDRPWDVTVPLQTMQWRQACNANLRPLEGGRGANN